MYTEIYKEKDVRRLRQMFEQDKKKIASCKLAFCAVTMTRRCWWLLNTIFERKKKNAQHDSMHSDRSLIYYAYVCRQFLFLFFLYLILN